MKKEHKEQIERSYEIARERAKFGSSHLEDKLKSDSGYQRRQRLGADGRMREAMLNQERLIKERREQSGESCTNYSEIQRQVAERAERIAQKKG